MKVGELARRAVPLRTHFALGASASGQRGGHPRSRIAAHDSRPRLRTDSGDTSPLLQDGFGRSEGAGNAPGPRTAR